MLCFKNLLRTKRQSSGLEMEENLSVEDEFILNAPISTNEVSMFKLAIEVCFGGHFGLIQAIFLSLGSTNSGYFFGTLGTIDRAETV